jgi:hypothetical protein
MVKSEINERGIINVGDNVVWTIDRDDKWRYKTGSFIEGR